MSALFEAGGANMEFAAEQEAFLLSVAQLAVAFAGFAGVIGAFSRFTTDGRVVAFRVRAMVALSLHALMMALAPFALKVFGLSPEETWRSACAFAAAVAIAVQSVLIWQGLPLFREKLLHTGMINFGWNVIGAAVIALLVAVSFGAMSAVAAEIYVAAIVYLVLLCAFNFLMLIISVKFDSDR